ncbi:ATPase subunit of ABC transporter with duplicated ATPase domains [Clostridium punense]|uniref:ATPase subunit of ABC transporter with duplicated ATPase domains n=1 Tax=Clostridium punense TaxID=1054297 RepID=A0ABS4JZG1_9CLOT|nr:ABC-F family ATP-binding cassette domain-containing protein [Clostridium punense]MBP2020922.1 ATPase subunit of ABC transporter with duplicated ATPase domains [Clostridium punense]
MIELSLNNVMKYLDANLVLKNISFNIYDNERVGIVGVNGSGKTTILKLIAGVETMTRDDKGWISIPRGKTIGYLQQVPIFPEDVKVSEVLNLAFKELDVFEAQMKLLEQEMKSLEGEFLEKALKRYGEMQHQYEVQGGYDRIEKLSKICGGLNFNEDFLEKNFTLLSGGEKTIVMLGKILLENPDILLLDEPTNHLDMESIEWLESFLKTYKGIVIIVSHDRYFLDNVVTKIIEIEDMECETYRGNYSEFVKQKEENMLLQFQQFKEQQKQIKAMEKAIKELRDWAIRADNNKFFKRAASMQIRLDKMQKIQKPRLENDTMKLNFKETGRSGNEVIVAKAVAKGYKDKQLFSDLDLLVSYGERTALIGANGSGKTTFLKIVLGEEISDEGSVKIGESVKLAYLPQNIQFNNEELTVLECFREDVMILEGKAREYLSKFMFYGSSVFKKVKHISGGEKVRLKLSKLLYEDINLLILDEPTNHLDIESIEALEAALEDFKGTILFISHDRYFINKMANRIIEIDNKQLKTYIGNYEYYKNEKSKLRVQATEQQKIVKEKPQKVRVVDETKKREKEICKLENTIADLETEIKEVDEKMNLAAQDYTELNKLFIKKNELKNKLDEVIEIWIAYNDENKESNN